MSEKKNDGGPAFPESHIDCASPSRGMTLRDYFADTALGTMIIPLGHEDVPDEIRITIARACYEMADAMLKERGK